MSKFLIITKSTNLTEFSNFIELAKIQKLPKYSIMRINTGNSQKINKSLKLDKYLKCGQFF